MALLLLKFRKNAGGAMTEIDKTGWLIKGSGWDGDEALRGNIGK